MDIDNVIVSNILKTTNITLIHIYITFNYSFNLKKSLK